MEPTMISAVQTDPIVAVSTPSGMGGIAVVRLSGKDADKVLGKCWKGVALDGIASHSAHLGKVLLEDDSVLDEVVLTFSRVHVRLPVRTSSKFPATDRGGFSVNL